MTTTYEYTMINDKNIEKYALLVADGWGKRKTIENTITVNDTIYNEVKVDYGDVLIAVKNKFLMTTERVEIEVYGVDSVDAGKMKTRLVDRFDGRLWDSNIHNHYKDLINQAVESVGRYAMFKLV